MPEYYALFFYENEKLDYTKNLFCVLGFLDGTVVNNPSANAEDISLIPGLVRSPEEVNENPRQYSCLGNFIDRGAWQSTVPGVTKSQTQFSNRACDKLFITGKNNSMKKINPCRNKWNYFSDRKTENLFFFLILFLQY